MAYPEEDGEQQQRVFRALSERFRLFNQEACLLQCFLSFGRSIAFDVHERGYERDLKLNLLATQRWRRGQGRDLDNRSRILLGGFDQGRTVQRALSRLAPKVRGLLDQARFGTVSRQQFRLIVSKLGKVAFKFFRYATMEGASRLAQERAIGRVLHQRMLEQVTGMGWYALPKEQASGD